MAARRGELHRVGEEVPEDLTANQGKADIVFNGWLNGKYTKEEKKLTLNPMIKSNTVIPVTKEEQNDNKKVVRQRPKVSIENM